MPPHDPTVPRPKETNYRDTLLKTMQKLIEDAKTNSDLAKVSLHIQFKERNPKPTAKEPAVRRWTENTPYLPPTLLHSWMTKNKVVADAQGNITGKKTPIHIGSRMVIGFAIYLQNGSVYTETS